MKIHAQNKTWLIVLLLLALLYTPIFMHLDYLPIRMWDESFLGIHTYEMMENGDYIITRNHGDPEMSNCKPPLAIWAMVVCSRLLGFTELSMRLPSALAALALCLAMFYLLCKHTGSYVFAFIAVLILITSPGYVRNHVIRTAEYDSILVLLSFLAAFQLFLATEVEEKDRQGKHILYFFIALTLAVLDKGIVVMMMAPGLFFYVLIRRKLGAFLKNRYTYMGIAIFLFFGLGYYFLRERMNPGYLQAVWDNELGGRYTEDISARTNEGWIFYLREIWQWQFTAYLAILPIGIIIGLLFSDAKTKRLVQFCIITTVCFLLVISSAATKLPHYDAPIFPFLAILTTPILYLLYKAMSDYWGEKGKSKNQILAFVIMLGILAKPYIDICQTVYFPKGDFAEEPFTIACTYFRDAVHKRIPQPYKLTSNAYYLYAEGQVLRCYSHMLQINNLNTGIIPPERLNTGDTAVVFDEGTAGYLNSKFEVKWIQHFDRYNANVVVLLPKKPIAVNSN